MMVHKICFTENCVKLSLIISFTPFYLEHCNTESNIMTENISLKRLHKDKPRIMKEARISV